MNEVLYDTKAEITTELSNNLMVRLCYLSIMARIPITDLMEWAINDFLIQVENNPSLTTDD